MQKQVNPQSLANFAKTVLAIAALVIAIPVSAKLMHFDNQYVNPPLGALNSFVVPLAVVLVGLCGVIPWLFATERSAVRGAIISAFFTVVLFFSYATLISTYVVRVDLPQSKVLQASVGAQRTEWANANLDHDSDEQALMKVGWTDLDIKRIWTLKSLLAVRLRLLGSFIGIFSSFLFAVGSLTRLEGLMRSESNNGSSL